MTTNKLLTYWDNFQKITTCATFVWRNFVGGFNQYFGRLSVSYLHVEETPGGTHCAPA